MFRKTAVIGAGVLGLVGCNKPNLSYRGAAGSLALSQDGSQVYAVDTDNQALLIADAKDGHKLGQIQVGKDPVRVVVGNDGRVYVSNRGERTVSVVDPKAGKELAKIPVGVEPTGLSLSDDGKTLYAVSATDADDPQHGTLTAVDTDSLKPAWRAQLGEEPRGVAVVQDKAYVSHLKDGRLSVVDLKSHQVHGAVDLNNIDSPDPKENPSSASVGLVQDVAASPDGKRVYAPHSWQRNGAITIAPGTPGGYYQRGGPCGVGAIVTAGVSTVETKDDQSKTDSFAACAARGGATNTDVDYPPSALFPDRTSGTPSEIIQGPAVVLVDRTSSWLFVVNRESNNVVVMPANKRVGNDPAKANFSAVVHVGAGPDGIALSKDGKTAYVYSQLDHSLSLIQQDDSSSNLSTLHVTSTVQLAQDTLPPDLVAGRKMFFDATNPAISSPLTGVACASCHVGGMEDGHVWRFPDGPRQTPALAGRFLDQTAPYHWSGVFPRLQDFYNETLIRRMGGTGLSGEESQKLTNYILSMPAAENPLQNRPDLQATIDAGKQAFQKAGCESCHAGQILTDNKVNDVGTLTDTDKLETETGSFQAGTLAGLNTPSLAGLGRTAPYLHDGSALTIRSRLDQSRFSTKHGDTSSLSDQEIADLEVYLLSL